MPVGVKGFQKGHTTSVETRRKIGDALRKPYKYNCDFCGKACVTSPSQYKGCKRHYCSVKCYAGYRRYFLPVEEQPSYKNGGMPEAEKARRRKARGDLNHAVRDGRIQRQSCSVCDEPCAVAHHPDYDKQLMVIWLCTIHHKQIHENPELLDG